MRTTITAVVKDHDSISAARIGWNAHNIVVPPAVAGTTKMSKLAHGFII